jgi:hypothetical protein
MFQRVHVRLERRLAGFQRSALAGPRVSALVSLSRTTHDEIDLSAPVYQFDDMLDLPPYPWVNGLHRTR